MPICLGFKEILDRIYQNPIFYNKSKEPIEYNPAVFLAYELSIISKQQLLLVGWLSEKQIQVLVEMAIPLFIFASTACQYIRDD